MKRRIILAILVFVLSACQAAGPRANGPTLPVATKTVQPLFITPQQATTVTPRPENPNPIEAEHELLQRPARPFGGEALTQWQMQPYAHKIDALPVDLSLVANPGVIANLTADQRDMLSNSGFTVLTTGEKRFGEIRDNVSKIYGQPYYLTTDAAYHALYLTFQEALKILEREHFRELAIQILQRMMEQVRAFSAGGAPLESDVQLSAAYLAVGLRLFDPDSPLPADLETQITPQIEQIMAGTGRAQSALIPGFEDDFGAYKPVGHYAGDPDLEAYFRGMSWLGRAAWKLKDPQNPSYRPSRAPLILTLALRQDEDAALAWKNLNELMDFIVGPTDDPGPAELLALIDAVYGPGATFTNLGDEARWQDFLRRVDDLPAPAINATFLESTAALEASRDWRLLGQRFTFDAAIFQNLIYDRVGTPEQQRKLPSGLDVMAVFGSPAAKRASRASGSFDYANYERQLARLQVSASQQTGAQWLSRFYNGWLYSFFPLVAPKGESYPPYMRTEAWQHKDLTAALGSWATLKHASVLYAKMPEFMGGGGPPASGPAPAFVEPNPDVFYILAFIAAELSTGLAQRLPFDLVDENINYSYWLRNLADRYRLLGQIAVKELYGQPMAEDDFEAIQHCLGPVDCLPEAFPDAAPIPLLAAVAGADNDVLAAGVGYLDRIYVVIPIDGALHVAQGGVFSYYEFVQPRVNRLTDAEWRQQLEQSPPDRPTWAGQYLRSGGGTAEILAFRAGDWYKITAQGGSPPLNIRAGPSKNETVLARLGEGEYIQFVDDPVVVDGANWWKIQQDVTALEGWVMENPAWYERAHGQ